jgi:hypothetical protein
MTLGGVIEADRRMRAHEVVVRQRWRVAKVEGDRQRVRNQLRQLEAEEADWEKKQLERTKKS